MTRRLLTAVVIGGAVAGLVDIAMAAVINQTGLEVIMRAIARGVLGGAAMQGGTLAALLGLALQVAMGALIGLIYGLAALKAPVLTRRWVAFGLLYGVAVFAVMNWVVVPLSAVGAAPKFTPPMAAANLAAMIIFALMITVSAHRGARG